MLGLVDVVAAAERRLDAPVLAEHARADIQDVIVVDNAHVHRVGRRRTFGGLLLDEIGDGRRLLPRLVIEPSVDPNRPIRNASSGRLFAVARAVDWSLRDADDAIEKQKRTTPTERMDSRVYPRITQISRMSGSQLANGSGRAAINTGENE